MTTLALFRPTGLLASELREGLERHPELWDDVRLLSDRDDEVGTLTQLGDEAALVAAADDVTLDALDVALFFGRRASYAEALARVPGKVARLIVSTEIDAGWSDAESAEASAGEDALVPVVAGVNSERITSDALLVSPHPSVVALAHLLHPLRGFGLAGVGATLLEPVSSYGKEGLDEMFRQTRALLAFSGDVEREVLPAQLAFNAVDVGDDTAPLAAQLAAVLGVGEGDGADDGFDASLHLLRVGVFHSLSLSLHVRLAEDPGLEAVRAALAASERLDLDAAPEGRLGATDAASRDEILVGRLEPDRRGGYRLWAVMDNLVCGGTGNALAILRGLLPTGS